MAKVPKLIRGIPYNSLGQGWPTCCRLGSTRKFLANSCSTGR